MSNKERVFKVAGVYTAIILGAGFASGQELINFFVRFGRIGFMGLVVSGILFALVGWAALEICLTKNISSFDQFMDCLMGPKLGKVMKLTASVFLFVLFATMLAAGGAALEETFRMPFTLGVVILGVLCFTTFLFDLDGIVEINTILAPIMVAGGIFIGLYTFINRDAPVFLPMGMRLALKENWLVSAIVYASYNIITAITVLTSMKKIVTNKKVACWGGVLGGLSMTLLGIFLSLPMMANYEKISAFEIPLLSIMNKFGSLMEYFYLLILLAAIFTTAISNGFAFMECAYTKLPIGRNLFKALMTAGAVFLAHMGFSTLVGKVYPLFALFGFLEIIIILRLFFIMRFSKE